MPVRARLAATLLLCLPLPLLAADSAGVTGEEVVDFLHDLGYRAKLGTDSDGDPKIDTRMSGVNVTVGFYDCHRDGRCDSLQFTVGFDLEDGTTPAVVNAFNNSYRYGRAYLDDEADPWLQMDFEMLHTLHAKHFASQVETYELLLGKFIDATDFHGGGAPDDEAEAKDAVEAGDARDADGDRIDV